MLRGKEGAEVLVGKGNKGGGGGGTPTPEVMAALAQISCVRSANKDKMFCWAAKVG